MGDVARKVMGDVPVAYIEGAGGTRVSEDEIVSIGNYDVSTVVLMVAVLTHFLVLQFLIQLPPPPHTSFFPFSLTHALTNAPFRESKGPII